MKFVSVHFVIYFLWKEILAVSLENNYHYDGLIKYLKEESKLHQVVFILNDELNNTNQMMNSLMKEVDKNFPTSSYNNITIFHKFCRRSLLSQRFRKTTLFVVERTFKKFQEKEFTEFDKYINILSTWPFPPRILVVNTLPSTHEVSNKTLQIAWEYLDFSDMTITTYDYQCSKILKPCTSNLPLWSPFTNKYSESNISSKSEWISKKLVDLNGYEFYFVYRKEFFPLPKHSNTARQLGDYLSQAMNLTLGVKSTFMGQIFKSILFMENVLHSELTNDRILKLGSMKVVILNKFKNDEIAVLSSELFYMLFGTICIITIIRLVAIFLKFKKSVWETLSICQIIMGTSTNQEPVNSLERFVFGLLLVSCIVYSGYFYTVILDITWRSEPDIPTLEELANHPLPPMTTYSMRDHIELLPDDPFVRKLFERALDIPHHKELYCLEYLSAQENISSCLITDAEFYVNIYQTKARKSIFRILPETVLHTVFAWTQMSGKPYIDRFNEMILRASEHGFLKDFFQTTEQPAIAIKPELIKKETLFIVLFYVSVIGYSLSMIVFLIEVLEEKLENKIHGFYAKFRISV